MSRVFWIIAAAMAIGLSGTLANAGTIYQTDFSSDPGWTTGGTGATFSVSAGVFNGSQDNWGGSYAYANVAGFDPNRSWQLEFDRKINSATGGTAGNSFGLFGPHPIEPLHAWGILSTHSNTSGNTNITYGGAFFNNQDVTASPPWATNTWYHWAMAYDETTDLVTAQGTDRTTGSVLWNLDYAVTAPFDANITFVGVFAPTRFNGDVVDYNLDNIVLRQEAVPEPSSIVVMGGLFGTFGLGMWWRRRRKAA
jgi:hypothetical protein